MGFYRIADINIEIETLGSTLERACEPYTVPDCRADEHITADPYEYSGAEDTGGGYSPENSELVRALRLVNGFLWKYDAFLLHGAAFTLDGAGFVLCAPSGTGKSTHLRLLRTLLGQRCDIINGDKPIVRLRGGVPVIYGSPWRGKEGWGKNRSAPLRGIVFINRAKENSISPLSAEEALPLFMRALPVPRGNTEGASRTLEAADTALRSAALFKLNCNMALEAAEVSSRALLGGI